MFKKLLALIAAMVMGAFVLTACTANTSPDEYYSELERVSYTVNFSDDHLITRITDPSGNLIFNENYDEEADTMQMYNSLAVASASASKLTQLDAQLNINGDSVAGEAILWVTTDNLAALATAHNALPEEVRERKYVDTSTFGGLLLNVLEQVDLQEVATQPVQFVASDEPTLTQGANSAVADAYQRNLPAWQVAQGSSGFDYEKEYAYDFSCDVYEIEEGDNNALLSHLSETVLPELELVFTVDDLNDYQLKYRLEGDTPCGIKVVDKEDDSPSLPIFNYIPPPEAPPMPVEKTPEKEDYL